MNVTNDDGAPGDDVRRNSSPPAFPSVIGAPPADEETRVHRPLDPLFSRPATDTPPYRSMADEPPLPAAPVEPVPGQARWRWVVAALATIAVVAVVGAVFLLGGPRAGAPSITALHAPADTAAYAELRLDMPGDQRDRVAAFMSHFPGFTDPASFEQKLDDTLNQVLLSSGMGIDWNSDVDPWFGGSLAIMSSTISPSPGTPPSFTAVLTVRDRAALDAVMAEHDLTANATPEDYEGHTIWTSAGGPDGQRLSFSVTDEVLLVGLRVEDVKDALDVRADREPGLADDPYFVQQLAGLHADGLATAYFDGRAANLLNEQLGGQMPGLDTFDWLMDASAVRTLGQLRAEADHLAFVSRTERPADADLPPLPANRTTDLAELAPGDSLGYVELRDVGRSVGFAIERLLEPLASAEGGMINPDMFSQLLGTPPQDFLDFIGDVGVAAAYDGTDLEAGLMATVDDEAIARQRLERVLSAIRSLAAFGGGLSVEEEVHGDATITVISLPAVVPEMPVSSVSVTVNGGHMLIGLDDFVVNALDRASADSLAARPEYQAALAAGGRSNAGLTFVDIAGLRAVSEGFMSAEERALYEREQRPFVEPLSHFVVINSTDGSITVSHALLYVE